MTRWGIPLAWVIANREVASQELARIKKTIRYRLGEAVIRFWARPWRIGGLISTVLTLSRETGGGYRPLRFQTMVFPADLTGDETDSREARREAWKRWRELDHAMASRAYLLGTWLIEIRRTPWRVFSIPFKSETSAGEGSPLIEFSQRPPATPGGAQHAPLSILAPNWLCRMAAFEGLETYDNRRSASLLVGLDQAMLVPERITHTERLIAEARHQGVRVGLWILGDHREIEMRLAKLATHVETFFSDRANRLEEYSNRLKRPVEYLAPCIQPQLHNPALPATGNVEEVPARWYELQSKTVYPEQAHSDEAQRRVWFRTFTRLLEDQKLSDRIACVEAAICDRSVKSPKLISVIACTRRPSNLAHVIDCFERQDYPHKELTVVLHGEAFDVTRVRRLLSGVRGRMVAVDSSKPLGKAVQIGFEASAGDYLVRFDDDDWYGSHFVTSLAHALDYSSAGVVGKASYFARFDNDPVLFEVLPGREFCYHELYGGNRLMIRREVWEQIAWRSLATGEDTAFVNDCLRQSVPLFSADSYNFVAHRDSRSRGHTWSATREEILDTHAHRQWRDGSTLAALDVGPDDDATWSIEPIPSTSARG